MCVPNEAEIQVGCLDYVCFGGWTGFAAPLFWVGNCLQFKKRAAWYRRVVDVCTSCKCGGDDTIVNELQDNCGGDDKRRCSTLKTKGEE